MELYLLKSAIILTILYGFYKIVLENESMHVFKRFYLLGSLPVAFLIPLVTFTSYVEVPFNSAPVVISHTLSTQTVETPINFIPYILWSMYVIGVIFFSIKFGKNLSELISRIKHNPIVIQNSINHILLKPQVIPHTFLNYVFLNKQKFEANEIPDEVIQHEHVHAKQKHTIDILIIEFLQIIFWFNPLLYFIKGSIKLNHEFLADRAVLNRGSDPVTYQKLLLAFSSNAITPSLANSINYSFIKKRFTVMKKQTPTRSVWLRSLLLLPLMAILLYGFSTKQIIKNEISTEQAQTETQQVKATQVEIEEYNNLAKKYNSISKDNKRMDREEVNRLTFLYSKLTAQQKEKAEPFPHFPPPPTPPDVPEAPEVAQIPPAPPLPAPDPVWYIEKLHNEGAKFIFEEKEINYKKAIEIIKKNNSIRIDVKTSNRENPLVTLTGGC